MSETETESIGSCQENTVILYDSDCLVITSIIFFRFQRWCILLGRGEMFFLAAATHLLSPSM